MQKLFGALLLIVSLSANAEQATSFGATNCGDWVDKPTFFMKTWATGYLSGVNSLSVYEHHVDVLDRVSSPQQIFLYIDNWCKSHPLEDVNVGLNSSWAELVEKK